MLVIIPRLLFHCDDRLPHVKLDPFHLPSLHLDSPVCSGSVDGNNQLIIKGRFQQKQVETVLRRYISERSLGIGWCWFDHRYCSVTGIGSRSRALVEVCTELRSFAAVSYLAHRQS